MCLIQANKILWYTLNNVWSAAQMPNKHVKETYVIRNEITLNKKKQSAKAFNT